ncbi:hypothetical protein DB347_08420 [Opitutaceae bacterium EW11]|nr:hypothetical protein DB347_08420 [Opitutaceae bacterium EW11]
MNSSFCYEPSVEEVRERAYSHTSQVAGPPGCDMDSWLTAEPQAWCGQGYVMPERENASTAHLFSPNASALRIAAAHPFPVRK